MKRFTYIVIVVIVVIVRPLLRASFIVALTWFIALSPLGCGSSATPTTTGGGGGAGAWQMPNQPGSGLPNPQNYTVLTIGSHDVVRDEVTKLVWQRRPDPRRFTWKEAITYCDGLALAGWTDWRLPSRIELVSLLHLGHTDPSIDEVAFPETPSEWFWTASRQADDPGRAWFVYFYFGYPDTDPDTNPYPARCVR